MCALATAVAVVALAPARASSAPAPKVAAATETGRAVVLVSGFNTRTPFTITTPDRACTGKEGDDWYPSPNPKAGVASTLKAAGFRVFTAPVRKASGTPAPPCAPASPTPPVRTTYINSNGDLNANGQALGRFLAFLRDNYSVTKVDFVGHSDGGLWTRAAITQQSNYPGVAVTSLTTLGGPHTGSFAAGLAEDISNGKCHAQNPIEQRACIAMKVVVALLIADLGEPATEQLSSDYLTTWNPEQTIGACQVTGIAGTFFNPPLPSILVPGYYNPSDGLVGVDSALGQASRSIDGRPIPAPGFPSFRNGGEFPVVHGLAFNFLSKKNLVNQQAISNVVLATLQSQPAGGTTCSTTTQQSNAQPAATSTPPGLTDGAARITVPLHQFSAPVNGVLPRPRRGDRVLFNSPSHVACGGRRLGSTSFLGDSKLRVALPRCTSRLRVRGPGQALLLTARGRSLVRIQGTRVTVLPPRGARPRNVVLQIQRGQGFKRIPLSRSGRGVLPTGAGPTTLRVTVTTRAGQRLVGSATVSR